MKKVLLCAVIGLSASLTVKAQNTSPWPSTGNVGIGTNSPTKLLEVNGEAMFYGKSLIKRQSATETENFVWFSNNAFAHQGYLGYGSDGVFRLRSYTNAVELEAGAANNLTLLDNGNVGVGTTNPLEKLHVNGAIRGNRAGGALRVQTDHGYLDIGAQNEFFAHIYSDRPITIFNNEIASAVNKIRSYNDDLQFKTGDNERMRLDFTTGNVGISNGDPVSLLTVGGNTQTNVETTGITMGVDQRNIEFIHSPYGSGFGSKIYNLDHGSGKTSFRIATRGNSTTWEDALHIEASSLATNGYVGIGTTDPSERLEVKGNVIIKGEGGGTAHSALRFRRNDSNNDFGYIGLRNLANSNDTFIMSSAGNGNPLRLVTNADPIDFSVDNDATAAMTINSNGNVGIGVNNPSNKLHLYNKNTLDYEYNTIFDTNSMTFNTPTNQSSYINKTDGGHLRFRMGSAYEDAMIIKSDKSVGIGTLTTGAHKLAVHGSIGAREVKVETTVWPDYVFENDYNLPTLQEVEQHIHEKGHLKDIPSATEVEKNGIYLGEMDSKLLQKIEELTLYTIQQQKEIETLKKENKTLKEITQELLSLKKVVQKLQEDK